MNSPISEQDSESFGDPYDPLFAPAKQIARVLTDSASCMSIVLASDSAATLRPVIEHLHTTGEKFEVIVVVPSSDVKQIASFASSDSTIVVGVESGLPLIFSRAVGIKAATCPFVFIGETHSFPQRGMLGALLATHALGFTAAVPAFENANPDGAVSWAGFITGYASFTAGINARELQACPAVNVSYRRSFLLGLGNELDFALSSGGDMVARLKAGGHRIGFEPAARVAHANNSFLVPWLRQRYLAGRVIGGSRSKSWSGARRAIHALTSPLILFVLLARHREGIRRTMRRNRLPIVAIPTLILGSALQAAGEMVSYVAKSSSRADMLFDELEIQMLAYTRTTITADSPPSCPAPV